MDAVIVGEIPGSVFTGGALACEAGAPQRFDVESAMEAGAG